MEKWSTRQISLLRFFRISRGALVAGSHRLWRDNRCFHKTTTTDAQPLPDWNYEMVSFDNPPLPLPSDASGYKRKTSHEHENELFQYSRLPSEFTQHSRPFQHYQNQNAPRFRVDPVLSADCLSNINNDLSQSGFRNPDVAVSSAYEVEVNGVTEQDHTDMDEAFLANDLEERDAIVNTPLPVPPPLDDYIEAAPVGNYKTDNIAKQLPLPNLSSSQISFDKDSLDKFYELSRTPGLASDGYPPDGQSRFDWRQRSLSRLRRPFSPDIRPTSPEWLFYRLPWRYARINKVSDNEHPLKEPLQKYRDHFRTLLELEQNEEWNLYNQRLEWPTSKLVKEGYMLEGMRGRIVNQKKYNGERQRVVYKFSNEKGRMLVAPRFCPGQYVILSRSHPHHDSILDKDGKTLMVPIQSVSKGSLSLIFPQLIPDIDKSIWRLDIGFSDYVFVKQRQAIETLKLDPLERDMAGNLDSGSLQNKMEEKLQGTALRIPLLKAFQGIYPSPEQTTISGAFQPHSDGVVQTPCILTHDNLDTVPNPHAPPLAFSKMRGGGILARNILIKSWAERYRSDRQTSLEIEGDPHIPLNRTQLRAMGMMLSEPLSLVQGPPGTGKTRVIVETIKLLKHHFQIPHPILICAHTNVAVDNLAAGLMRHGVKAVRAGVPERVPTELKEQTLERRLEEHPKYPWLSDALDKAKRLSEGLKSEFDTNQALKAKVNLRTLNEQIWRNKKKMIREVLLDADVVCSTCLSAASATLDVIDFPIVFLDEASMATEPLSLLPLVKGSSHVAIIGDHKQLPPVIISQEAHANGLSTSLFERLIHEGHVPSIMLDTQYRMHPTLSAFPSKTFYSGLLKDGTPSSHRLAPQTSFLLPEDPIPDPITGELRKTEGRENVTFWSHSHPESPMLKSLANHRDAEIAIDIVADLLYKNLDLKGSEIGIITPYLAQITVLKSSLQSTSTWENLVHLLGPVRAQEIADIEVKTVDGFEGREKEVIIFSTVRSNPGGWIGFLGDWRRVNVGLTRARRGLIMIGSKETLKKAKVGFVTANNLPEGGSKVWRDYMEYLEREGLIMDIE
ncbi:hypothetical protein L204_106046 [Cryptococcus depauperatus]